MVLVLRPLQGLLNCIIFIYHKVDGLLKDDDALLFWPALKMVLRGEEGQVRIVSDLTLVRHHAVLSNVQFADDHPNMAEFVGDEDDEKDEENSSSLPRQNDDKIRATSSMVSSKVNDVVAAVEETDEEEANNIRGDQLCPIIISATTTANINANSSTNTNGPDGENSAQAEHAHGDDEEEEEQILHYQQFRIQPKSKPSEEFDDGQESSQDLSGFQQSSSLASGSLPLSLLESND